ncbi:hypothetical protein KIW84_075724 [Lathyrus oleraceus]|uniref:Uncharacterized protein n=1 Tax=Pisum sativum TaxID=3888 RepID=A0A9D4VX71_PEA|nr:hypothetical protein KIW84_075724 [Pisum sativum]
MSGLATVDEASGSNIRVLFGFSIPKLVLQIVTVDAIFRVTSPSVSEFVILKETAFTVYSKARRVSFSSHTAKPVSTKVCSKSVKMLVKFETPAGFALFKVLNKGKLSEVQDLSLDFSTADAARKVAKLKAFSKFENNSSGLIDDSHDIKTSNNTNILGSLTLGIIKVSKGTQEVQNQDMAKLVDEILGEVSILVFMFFTLMLRSWHQPGSDGFMPRHSGTTDVHDKNVTQLSSSTFKTSVGDQEKNDFASQLLQACDSLKH